MPSSIHRVGFGPWGTSGRSGLGGTGLKLGECFAMQGYKLQRSFGSWNN